MIGWIMECVTTTSFSICINGSLHGYFKGKRGLRQGDPLSPYLFTLVMEILTLIIRRRVRESDLFTYHRYCSKLELVNLCFADDLFLFAYGDTSSASVIMAALDEFKLVSGLTPSLPKSTAYFCGVTNHVKHAILQILPFEEGRLPVKYLGVPLVSSRLIFRDCKELLEKVQIRVDDWKNKSLSIAGRLQLVNSVLGSLHVFWASVFMLPTRILLDIEQIMRGFLWCQGKLGGGKAKVAWNVVCLPKDEGGLGIRKLDAFNKALMTTQVWKLLSRKESLWVEWIHVYKLRGRSFWDIPYRGNMTWGWRNVLKLRPLIREFIWKKIGNGSTTSVWFDRWCIQSPLADLISSRDIFWEGFNKETKVCDLVKNGVLDWPTSWLSKYPSLNAIDSPVLAPNSHDLLEWRNEDGLGCSFSAHTVWNTIRTKGYKVRWYDAVWFSCCIPRHAVHLWLVIRRRLKTQDLLRHWDNVNYLHVTCSLCESQPDSHEHFFFECSFSQQVWNQVKGVAGLASSNKSIYDTIDDIIPFAARKTSKSVIAKLVVAATSYFIWQERNGRLFKNKKRTVNQVVDCIMNTVRLKLMSCRLKKSRSACDIVKAWNLSEGILIS
ncbi:putative RNA-directed DNA polymerase, eukaryota, reverse transcriptase zinc-binding domain protein [Tanacetum coccineum]